MRVDFYFGPGSRYSYLASTQLAALASETGARFRWRAVLSGALTARTGGVPRSPQDEAYRSRDVARWAQHYGIAYCEPEVAPPDWRELAVACVAAGAFGAPTFVTEDGALFWGQDRLPLLRDHLLALKASRS